MSADSPDDLAALRARADAQWQRTLVDRRSPMPRIPWAAIGALLLLAAGCVILLAAGHASGSGSGTTTRGGAAGPAQVTPFPAPQGLPPEFFG